MRFVERAQHRVHFGLVTPALTPKPLHHVLIEPDREPLFAFSGIAHTRDRLFLEKFPVVVGSTLCSVDALL